MPCELHPDAPKRGKYRCATCRDAYTRRYCRAFYAANPDYDKLRYQANAAHQRQRICTYRLNKANLCACGAPLRATTKKRVWYCSDACKSRCTFLTVAGLMPLLRGWYS